VLAVTVPAGAPADLEHPLEVRLVSEACEFYGVALEGIFGSRRGYYSQARRAVALVLVDNVGWTERRVANFLNKHHDAVSDTLDQGRMQLRNDPLFFEIVGRLRSIVSPL
jgi:hypothetical protein